MTGRRDKGRILVHGERGLALILVLWSLMLLTVIALSFGFAVRVETAGGAALGDQVRAEAVAASGVRLALVGLLGEDQNQRWKMDGTVHQIPWPEATLRASVRAENAKIDLNLAPPELLTGLFANLLPDSDPEALTEAVLEQRERAAPQAAAAPARESALASPPRVWRRKAVTSASTRTAAPAAFRTVDELARLPGFDAASVRRLRPYLTVHGGNAKVDAASADVEVLAAIPDVTRDAAEEFVRERAARAGGIEALDLTLLGAGAAYLDANATAAVADIRAAAWLRDGAAATVEAVVELGRGGQSYQVLEWRDGWAGPAPVEAPAR